ncbi:hypothetical protein SAMN05216251_105112 [Actinacidiphila alni]|uniref:PE-PGRS family protein n=1 Tax=Actinacidiphila alni TaxID=380248 RepID=A0A1I2D778_9ACTN|nr:hypothetical protein [Actinacidiphila alni]SFE76369.1 hypothetical protein SAMN05216251_105112 [Actinacidiphila alni]
MTQPNRPGKRPTPPLPDLADNLPGPFIDEFVPEVSYKHRGASFAAVAFYRNGGHSVITVNGSKDHNKPTFGKPRSICRIARGRYQASFEMLLPTLGDHADFSCGVDVEWEVADFHLAAEKRVKDVEMLLRPRLLDRLRIITRRHGLGGAQAADEAIQRELSSGKWETFGSEFGLTTEVFVRIDLGRAAAEHNADMVGVGHGATVQLAIDQAAAARVQANLPAARDLIAQGETERYAYLLAREPERAEDILRALQVQAREQRTGALEYLKHLIDQGVVQRHQIDSSVQTLLDYARTVGDAALGGGLVAAPTALPATGLPTPPVPVPQVLLQPTGSPPEDARPQPPATPPPAAPPAYTAAPPRPPAPPTVPAPAAPAASATPAADDATATAPQQQPTRPAGSGGTGTGKVDYVRKSRPARGGRR